MKKKAKDTAEVSLPAYVDRIEDNLAVISLSENADVSFSLPLKSLPDNLAEGDHLKLTIEIDQDTTAEAQQRITKLQAELTKNQEPEMNIKL